MRLIGLTGGIGSGKSTVSQLFVALGAHLIDADELARTVVQPNQPAYLEIVDHFGPEILLPDNTLDRKALAAIVFQKKEELSFLNRVTHREIHRLRVDQTLRLEQQNPDAFILYDVPLLFENGMQTQLQRTILVMVDQEIQLQRLVAKRGFTQEEAQARIAHQMKQEEKAALASFHIDNNGSLEKTKEQVEKIYNACLTIPSLPASHFPSLSFP